VALVPLVNLGERILCLPSTLHFVMRAHAREHDACTGTVQRWPDPFRGVQQPGVVSIFEHCREPDHPINMSAARYAAAAWLIFLLIQFPFTPAAASQDANSNSTVECTLRVHVDGLRNSSGVVGSVVFKSRDGWPEDPKRAYRRGPTPIPNGQRQATVIWHLPPGDYGVAAIHDENRNAKLDRNFLGIPKEGFGFANNPRVAFSAPPFESALVHVGCPSTDTSIHLQYK
jgi:uncharacterized protein (DUF2141 family)